MDNVKENKLGTMPVRRLVFSMAGPLMISMLTQALYNIIDSIYVSRIGEAALTATSLSGPLQMLMVSCAVGTGVGVNSLVSRRLGEKKFDQANSGAMHGYMLCAILWIIFFAFGMTSVPWFFSKFTQDTVIRQFGTDYLSVCTRFCFGLMVAIVSERLLQSSGRASLSMTAQICGAVTNIILDPIMIFGLLGFPAMGIRGAAVATVIGQHVEAVIAVLFNLIKNKDIELSIKKFVFSLRTIKDIYAVGLPSILMSAIGTVSNLLMNGVLMRFSSTAVAVLGVYFKLDSFIFMPTFGLTQGLVAIVGYNYGAKKKARIDEAVKTAMVVAVAIMATGTLVFQLIPDKLMGIFNAEGELLRMGILAIREISPTYVIAVIAIVLGSMCTGVGDGMPTLVPNLVRQAFIMVPVCWLLAKYVGMDWVWFTFIIGDIVADIICIPMAAKVYRTKIKNLTEENA